MDRKIIALTLLLMVFFGLSVAGAAAGATEKTQYDYKIIQSGFIIFDNNLKNKLDDEKYDYQTSLNPFGNVYISMDVSKKVLLSNNQYEWQKTKFKSILLTRTYKVAPRIWYSKTYTYVKFRIQVYDYKTKKVYTRTSETKTKLTPLEYYTKYKYKIIQKK